MRHRPALSIGRPVQAFIAALVAAALATAILPTGAHAWAHNGDRYSTHDWFIDQALAVLNGRADGWFDAEAARLASDDPDTNPALRVTNDHVYHEQGVRGAGVQRVSEHYAAALVAYQAGVAARTAGDEAAAKASFTEASRQIGLLSHYYTDLLQPYHSAYAGIGHSSQHLALEMLVDPLTRPAGASPAWHNPSRTVGQIGDIRTTTVRAAAYSRARFAAIHHEMLVSPKKLTTRAKTILGQLFRRAAQDLANIIWSISRGAGASHDIGTLRVTIRYRGVAASEKSQGVYATILDPAGKPIEGVEARIAWPLPDGSVRWVRRWSDPTGKLHYNDAIGGGPLYSRRTIRVLATASLPDRERTASPWFIVSPVLADGAAGFRTKVADSTVAPGELAMVTSAAHDRAGRPVRGLLVGWRWVIGGRTYRTSALTDETGLARSTLPITSAMPTGTISVYAQVQSASRTRYASASLRRI